MSITPIDRPLPGEHIIGLAPETAADASRWWLRLQHLFRQAGDPASQELLRLMLEYRQERPQ